MKKIVITLIMICGVFAFAQENHHESDWITIDVTARMSLKDAVVLAKQLCERHHLAEKYTYNGFTNSNISYTENLKIQGMCTFSNQPIDTLY